MIKLKKYLWTVSGMLDWTGESTQYYKVDDVEKLFTKLNEFFIRYEEALTELEEFDKLLFEFRELEKEL